MQATSVILARQGACSVAGFCFAATDHSAATTEVKQQWPVQQPKPFASIIDSEGLWFAGASVYMAANRIEGMAACLCNPAGGESDNVERLGRLDLPQSSLRCSYAHAMTRPVAAFQPAGTRRTVLFAFEWYRFGPSLPLRSAFLRSTDAINRPRRGNVIYVTQLSRMCRGSDLAA